MSRIILLMAFSGVLACDKPTEAPVPEPQPQTTATPATIAGEVPPAPAPVAVADPTFEVRAFDKADVPEGLVTEGTVQHGARFTDANGDNLAVFWAVEDRQDLFAAHVLLAEGKVARVLREVKQLRGDCEFDYSAAFVGSSIGVTDLDADDRGEVTFAYKYACRSDVSPQDYKLVVLEDGDEAILRGSEIIIMGGEEPYGDGKYEAEGFEQSPKQLEHAVKLWKRNVTTTY